MKSESPDAAARDRARGSARERTQENRAQKSPAPSVHDVDAGTRERGIRVLDAMRTYYAAESAMRRRSQSAMGMNENDLSAMRFLLRATESGRDVGPKELARYLGLTSSSVTALLDRLEKTGHIKRSLSPFDRRALIVVPTIPTEVLEQAILGEVRDELVEVAKTLDQSDARIVIEFLEEMRDAVDQIDTPGGRSEAPSRRAHGTPL